MRILFSIAGLVLLFDQLTKFLAVWLLKPHASISIIPGVFRLSFVENTGIAFGLFQGHPEFMTLVISLSVLCLLVGTRFFSTQRFSRKLAYGFILGGAAGNWIDRMMYKHVIDFLDFHIWPVFNVADSCITIGVLLFIWFALRGN